MVFKKLKRFFGRLRLASDQSSNQNQNHQLAVLKKSTGQFTTTCRLTVKEKNELLRTRNFHIENSYN